MGKHGPKRGSRAYWHRRRASRLVPRMRYWRAGDHVGLLGFGGYKSAMMHLVMVEDRESPLKGQEIVQSATLVEVPPLFIYSIVALQKTPLGSRVLAEVPSTNAPKESRRLIRTARKTVHTLDSIEKQLDSLAEIRVHALTQPVKIGLKKTPEILELGLGGKTAAEQFAYAKSVLGKEVKASDVFAEGENVDVVGVTTGRGWQGVVKRFGVSLNPHKATAVRRHGGSLGGETQAKVMYTVPRAGQTGFHRRTDRNKRILSLSSDASAVTPKGGLTGAKSLRGDYLLIQGSLPGPSMRFVRLNKNPAYKTAKPEVKLIVK